MKRRTVYLPYFAPFDYEGLLAFYRGHPTGLLETYPAPGVMKRVVELGGQVGTVEIRNDEAHCRLAVDIDFPERGLHPEILERVRGLFDVNSDPAVVAKALGLDPAMKKLLAKHPGIRLPSGWDAFEIGIGTILGQLVSVGQARALLGQLIELLGEGSGLTIEGKAVKLFPSPAKIAASDLKSLGTTGSRKNTLRAFSNAVLEGRLDLNPAQDPAAFVASARQIPGIGPWTATYMAMKILRHADSFPETDLILARAFSLHSRELVRKMSPWRSYAAILFWKEYAEALKKKPGGKKTGRAKKP